MGWDSSITVRTNFPQVAKRLDQLGREAGDKALRRALNTTVDQGKTEMARQISKTFRLSVSQAKERLAVRKASKRNEFVFRVFLEATRRGKGRSMNLIAFVDKAVTLTQARKRMAAGEGGAHALRNGGSSQHALQVRFQIKRSGGRKVIPGAFIGNKGRTVFIRDGKGRLPIHALNTIDVQQMFNTKTVNGVVRKIMLERFAKNFEREMAAVLRGFGK